MSKIYVEQSTSFIFIKNIHVVVVAVASNDEVGRLEAYCAIQNEFMVTSCS